MADKKRSINHSRPYILGAIVLALVTAANMFFVTLLYTRNVQTSKRTSGAMQSVNRMNSELSEINGDVLSIIAGVGNRRGHANAARAHFINIADCKEDFEDLEGISDEAKTRFKHAYTVLEAYQAKLEELTQVWNAAGGGESDISDKAFGSSMSAMYTQDIYPLQVTASEMLRATIDIVNNDTAEMTAKNARLFIIIEGLMLAVAILGEIAVFIIAKMAKKARLELEEREKSLREVDAKLKTTRQKASDLALTNILTNMKNRYALDNDISERLEADRFNIAVFDMDNFRSINDTYGYDFGDEYLIAIADKLKNDFGSSAEIYNITGNEFCFVFNKEISENQAMGIVQSIHAVMSSPFEVLNLTVQLPASGSVYHYLPGDCLNVNSLLVKLDTALRNAKLNGGNMVNTVVDI
ncbi:MAG: GGDEF domain-containing protein [Ruminococcus sp.]|nr:GGDEF domain-containing protein [Ruminococcus sp.]